MVEMMIKRSKKTVHYSAGKRQINSNVREVNKMDTGQFAQGQFARGQFAQKFEFFLLKNTNLT